MNCMVLGSKGKCGFVCKTVCLLGIKPATICKYRELLMFALIKDENMYISRIAGTNYQDR